MDPSQLLLTAFVKFPSFRGCDIWISPYIRGLLKNHWSELESGNLNDDSMTLMVDMCQHIVNLTSSFILKAIKPVTSDWHRKSLQLQQYLYPKHCFFGVDESDVLTNLKNTLPRCVCNGFSSTTSVPCESLDKFIRLVATEVTRSVNSQIAAVMDFFNYSLQPMTFNCNCIGYTTLHTMIGLVVRMLRCIRRQNCQCTPSPMDLERPDTTTTTTATIRDNRRKRPLRMVIEQENCVITYCTFNKEVMDIMTEIPKCVHPIVGTCEASWCEDSDDWVYTDSGDVSERSGNHADVSAYEDDNLLTSDVEQRSYQTDTEDSDDWTSSDSDDVSECSGNHADIDDDDGALTTNTEQKSYKTDTQDSNDRICTVRVAGSKRDSDDDQSEDSFSQKSAETGPVCHEHEVDGSTTASALSSVTHSLQSVTYDDTKHQVLILVLVGLLLRTTKRARTSLPQMDFNRIIWNLRDKALGGQIHVDEIAVSSNRKSVRKVYKALFKDLYQHFGSAEVLLQAMKSQDPTIDDFLITTLRDHLILASPDNEKQRSAIVRFFSWLGSAIVKLFRARKSDSSTTEGDKQKDDNTSLVLAMDSAM